MVKVLKINDEKDFDDVSLRPGKVESISSFKAECQTLVRIVISFCAAKHYSLKKGDVKN